MKTMAIKAPAKSPNGGITGGLYRFMVKFRIWTHNKQFYREHLDMDTHQINVLLHFYWIATSLF